MLRSTPSAIGDALDTLDEPNAVFSQLLKSANNMVYFSVFISLFPLVVLSFLAFLVFSLNIISFPFSVFASYCVISFPLSFYLVLVSIFQLTCVCRGYAY